MRHLLLHEGSRKAENSGAEYGRAPRIVSGTGTRTPFALPSRTLRHRARKSAVTYAKRGAQSGLKHNSIIVRCFLFHNFFCLLLYENEMKIF